MPGMRMAADRIVKCIMCVLNGYGLSEVVPWRSIAQRLGNDCGILEAPPFVFKRNLGGPKLLVGPQSPSHRWLRMSIGATSNIPAISASKLTDHAGVRYTEGELCGLQNSRQSWESH